MDPALLEYLRRQSGLPVVPSSESGPLPTPAASPSVPLGWPGADMAGRLGPDFDPAALRAAQQQDLEASRLRTFGDSMTRAAMLTRNQPVGETAPVNVSTEAVQQLGQRRADAMQLMGLANRVAGMDPNSDISKQEQQVFASSQVGQRFLARLGQMAPVWLARQSQQTLQSIGAGAKTYGEAGKAAVEPEKIAQDIEASRVETGGKTALQQPMSPEHLAALKQFGYQLPEGTTYAQAKDLAEQQMKGAAIQIDWQKLALERTKVGPEAVSKLRTELQGQQGYKDMQAVAASYQKIKTASATGAGDIALVYGYMKLLDPTSSVREGEYATAANAGGAWDKVGNLYNKVLRGEKLAPAVRDQFKAEAQRVYDAQAARYKPLAEEYRRLAAQQGVSPGDVVLDVFDSGTPPPPPSLRKKE